MAYYVRLFPAYFNDLNPISQLKPNLNTDGCNPNFTNPFCLTEPKQCINSLKNGKATGLENIMTKILKHFGHKALVWLLQLFNNSLASMRIPKIWLRSRVVALLKPGKDPSFAKSYRPISFLSHTFKLMEQLLLNRLSPFVEEHFIEQQAGFRPDKSTIAQILNLTQHIEDGFQKKKIPEPFWLIKPLHTIP